MANDDFNFVQDSTKSLWKTIVTQGAPCLAPYACFHGPSGINVKELNTVHFSASATESLKRFILKTAPLDNSSYVTSEGKGKTVNLNSRFLLNLDTADLYTGPKGTGDYGADYTAIGKTCSYFKGRKEAGSYPTLDEGVYGIPVPIRGAPMEFRKVYLEGKTPNAEPEEWDADTTYGEWSIYPPVSGSDTVKYEGKYYKSLESENIGNTPPSSQWEEYSCSNRYFAYFLCSAPIQNNSCGENYYNTRDENEQFELGSDALWEDFDIGSCGDSDTEGCTNVYRYLIANSGDSTYYSNRLPAPSTGVSGELGTAPASECGDILYFSGGEGINTYLTPRVDEYGYPASGWTLEISTSGTTCPSGAIDTVVATSTDSYGYETSGTWSPSGCDTLSFVGCSGIQTTINDEGLLTICYTGTGGGGGGGTGCLDGIKTIVTDNGTWNANGCDTLNISGCSGTTTSIIGETLVICASGGGGTGGTGCENALHTIVSDDGTWTATGCDTLKISGCSGIQTSVEKLSLQPVALKEGILKGFSIQI